MTIEMRCNVTFCHVMPLKLTLASDDATDIGVSDVMQLHWCQHLVMWTAASMAPLHFLGQGDHNEVQHDFSWSCELII